MSLIAASYLLNLIATIRHCEIQNDKLKNPYKALRNILNCLQYLVISLSSMFHIACRNCVNT